MNGAGLAEPVGALVGFVLTIFVFSYIIGDNGLFRLAIHIFIGVASGYAAALVIYNVLWYRLIVPLLQDPMGNLLLTVPALLLGIWLLTKTSARFSNLGNPVLAFLVGVGAATVIGGGVLGTVFPQVAASANLFDLSGETSLVLRFINSLIILIGTLGALIYFLYGVRRREDQPTAQRHPIIEGVLAPVGQFFVAVTLGVIFAGVYAAALAAMIERVRFIWNLVTIFFQ